jgi:hypothetical protein
VRNPKFRLALDIQVIIGCSYSAFQTEFKRFSALCPLEKRMRLLPVRVFVLLLTSVTMMAAAPAKPHADAATEETRWEIGAQGGFSFNDKDESFTQYEALLNYKLPWGWHIAEGFDLGMRVTSTAGVLDGGGESGFVGTMGLGFVFFDNRDLNVRIGSAATYLGKDVYGDEDLGTHFQFTSHLCVSYRFWDELSARVRVQHMSNASLSDENPGVNMLLFGLHYAF